MLLTRGRLLVVAAAVCWSLSGFFLKAPAIQAIDPEARGLLVACWRSFFAAGGIALFVDWKQVRWRPGLLPLVGFFAAMNLLYVQAMTSSTDAGNVIFLQYLAPFWVLLGSAFWLNERLERENVAGIACGLAGVAVIGSAVIGNSQATGALLAVGAGVTYAGVIICLRYLREEDPGWLVFLCFVCSGLVLLPFVLTQERQLAGEEWVWVGALGTVQMALAYGLFANGVRHIKAQEASLISLIEPVLNPIWVLLAWGAVIDQRTIVGGGLILLGLVVRYARAEGTPCSNIDDTGVRRRERLGWGLVAFSAVGAVLMVQSGAPEAWSWGLFLPLAGGGLCIFEAWDRTCVFHAAFSTSEVGGAVCPIDEPQTAAQAKLQAWLLTLRAVAVAAAIIAVFDLVVGT